MPFYKKDNTELLVSHTRVEGPGYSLDAENHSEHTYPVDGWYWFDTLEAAMAAMSNTAPSGSVTMRQACLELEDAGLLDDVEALVATLPRPYQIEWQRASDVLRDNALVEIVRINKGMSVEDIDGLFERAALR